MGAWCLASTVPLMGGEYTPIQSSGEGLSTFSHVTVTQSPEWFSSVALRWREMVKLSPVPPPLPVPPPVSFPVPVPPCEPACYQSENRIIQKWKETTTMERRETATTFHIPVPPSEPTYVPLVKMRINTHTKEHHREGMHHVLHIMPLLTGSKVSLTPQLTINYPSIFKPLSW